LAPAALSSRRGQPSSLAANQPALTDRLAARRLPNSLAYNSDMPGPALSADTPHEVECLQVGGWRRMSPAQKAAIVTGLTQAAYDMALAGVRQRYPDASPREQFLRLAILTLGSELAAKAYPDIAALDLA
jgi:hypothetical protein